MEKNAATINLDSINKREILEIFVNGLNNNKSEAELRREIRAKLIRCMPNYSESDFRLIYHDCKMYVLVKSINERKGYVSNEALYRIAKKYYINEYSKMSREELEKAGILEEIVNRFAEQQFSKLDEDLKKDIILYLHSKMPEKKHRISLDSVSKEFQNQEKYKKFIREYVISLLRMEEFRVPQEMEAHRRNVLVPDVKITKMLKRESAIEIAEKYIYATSEDGRQTRKINHSLVEEKLLTIFLEERTIWR